MKILVIIITYNGEKWVDKCFGSLRQSNVPLDVLVIDNGSTDNTLELIKSEYKEVEIIESQENLGFGKANNIGLERFIADGSDYAFLLNQDAWIEPDSIEKLITISKNHPNIGLLSPVHLNGKGDAIDLNFQNYLNSTNTPGFYSDLYLNKLNPFYKTTFVNAAAWLLSRECVQKVGYFDKDYNHYGEDVDYAKRLRDSGMELIVSSYSKIYHDRPQIGFQHNKTFTKNINYVVALLAYKNNKPKRHFLIRKLLALYFTLFFVYLGKDKETQDNIEQQKILFKLLSNKE
jgi:N-acetylglucosaminyl-diphospho-decaprenol L-rhamnosyltransferase